MRPDKRTGPAPTAPGLPRVESPPKATDTRIVRERWFGGTLYSCEVGAVAVEYVPYTVVTLGLVPHDRSRCQACQAVGA
jgi:hypothetical protein